MAEASKAARKAGKGARGAKDDATALLKQDHDDVRNLFAEYEELASDEADDGSNAEVAEAREALVGPGPVRPVEAGGRGALPEHRIADRADAERGEALKVIVARAVAAALELREVAVANPIDGALDAAPQLDRAHAARQRPASRRGVPMRRAKSARAWPTTWSML